MKVAYVGPTIKHGLLASGMVFSSEGFPPAVEELCRRCPSIKGLFVPIQSLASARKRVRTRGDILRMCAIRVAEALK